MSKEKTGKKFVFKPKKIEVKELGEDVSVTYREVFTLIFTEDNGMFEAVYVNTEYSEDTINEAIQKTLEYIQNNV